jgi:hypothetical protein
VESKSKNQLPLALACGIKIKKSIATGFSLWNQNQKNQLPLALACGIKIKKSIATGFRDCLKILFCKTTFKQTIIFISQNISSWRFGGFNIS